MGVELIAMSGQGLADERLSSVGLVEDSPAGHLVNVAGEQIKAQREAVLDSRVLDLSRFEAVDNVAQPLLRRDHEPEWPPLLLERLGQALQIEHALDASRDVLPHLVHDKDEACRSVASAAEEVLGAVGEPVVVD